MERFGDRVKVTELDLAIYIYMRSRQSPGLKIEVRDGFFLGPARHEVWFYDPDSHARSLEVEFANSPQIQFASAQRDLKKIIRRKRGDDSHARPDSGRGK